MHACLQTVGVLRVLKPPKFPHHPHSQTVFVSGLGPAPCQVQSSTPCCVLPWQRDTLQRNSVVAPTEAEPCNVCTFHAQLYLRHRELTESILKRGKSKARRHHLTPTRLYLGSAQDLSFFCRTMALLQFLPALRHRGGG